MESSSKIIPALNILRRLPPSKIRQNIAAVATLRPELQDEILQRVDQPLGILIANPSSNHCQSSNLIPKRENISSNQSSTETETATGKLNSNYITHFKIPLHKHILPTLRRCRSSFPQNQTPRRKSSNLVL